MQLVALSPVHVADLVWRRDARTYVLTVVCKASFDLVPGEMRLSAQQDVINERDQRWEDDPARSVHAPADLMPFKPRADVTLVGTAFAPQAKPTRSLVARLVCGTVDKAVAVFGDRPRPAHPEPATFTRMPLRYERAAGGPGTTNPVGTPERPPNLEPTRRGDGATPPIGFGPIAADWPERVALLRQYAGWSPNEPFPEDFDGGYFNVAPADQQLAALRNDQPLHLENLHPEHPRLSTRLPGLHPQAFVERPGSAAQEIEMRPDGLWIDTDRARCTVTWRAQVALASADEPGRVLVAMVGTRQQLAWGDVSRLDEALRGGQPQAPARSTRTPGEAVARSRLDVPSMVDPADEEDDNYQTTVTITAVKPQPRRTPPSTPAPPIHPHQAPLPSAPAPTVHPHQAPLPAPPIAAAPAVAAPAAPKRTATLQGLPPRRAPEPPPPPRPTIESEPTSTELFIVAENTPIFDNAPLWLAPGSQRPAVPHGTPIAPPVAPAAQPTPPPIAIAAAPPPIVAAPAIAAAPPPIVAAPAIAAAAPQVAPAPPAEPQSPWAAGTASAGLTAAPVASAVAPVAEARPLEAKPPVASRMASDEVVDLLWFDPEAVPRVRGRWPAIIDDLDFEPLDPRHDLPVDDPAASRDRHHVFGVLTRAEATDARGVAREMFEAIGDHGRFTAPVVVIGGELRFPLDDLEMLKTAAAAAKPLAKDDKKLTELLEMLAELMDTPLLQGSPSAVESLLKDLTSAIQQTRRPLPVKYLDAHLERVLLEKRRYQRRTVFGGPCIRALLGQGASAVPAYLPDALADKLPLVTSMKARLIAEVCPSQDQFESHPHALRVVALGRIMGLENLRR